MIISEQEYDFDGDAYGPDLTLLGPDKVLDGKRRVQLFVPDLAIEIVSHNDTEVSLTRNAKRYRKAGTKEVWIFDIENRDARTYNNRQSVMLEEDALFQSDLIPGLSIRLGELFDRI